jgi:hypothetical protein
MIDLFVLLTPILLLGVVALLGFAGCGFHPNQDTGMISISPTSGLSSGGTDVTVTGQYASLQSNVMVTFGETASDTPVPATIVGTAPSQSVTAQTPAHAAGAVDVILTYTDSYGDNLRDLISYGFTFYDPVTPVGTVLTIPATNVKTQSASLPAVPGNKLVIVTVVWGTSGGNTLKSLTAPGVTFSQIGTTDPLGLEFVATFYAVADLTSGITVTATLNTASAQDFDILISAYDHADPTPVGPVSNRGTGTGSVSGTTAPSLPFSIAALAPGDMIYAVAIAGNAADKLVGSWKPGQNLTAQIGQNGYLMLEVRVLQQSDIDTGTFPITATDSLAVNPPNASRWYLFGMAVRHG